MIGRIAMPIFAFQIALGYKKTHSKTKYLLRILWFALYSEIPFMMMRNTHLLKSSPSLNTYVSKLWHSTWYLNIGFTFFIALLLLWLLERSKTNTTMIPITLSVFLVSLFLPMDYGFYGVVLVLIFYYFMDHHVLCTSLVFTLTTLYVSITLWLYHSTSIYVQFYMLLALPLIYLYNGEKGKSLKGLFYAFYPIHMLVLVAIKALFFT